VLYERRGYQTRRDTMPRRARLDAPGTLHHVIVRGIEKRRIVNDVADRKNFVQRLGELAAATKTAVYAWALMTNHAHILLRSSEMGLSGFMWRLLSAIDCGGKTRASVQATRDVLLSSYRTLGLPFHRNGAGQASPKDPACSVRLKINSPG
jgi:hypothetical protein